MTQYLCASRAPVPATPIMFAQILCCKTERGMEVQTLVAQRGSELRDRVLDRAKRTGEAVGQAPTDRCAKLAAAGVALITLMVIVRRVRHA